MSLYNSLLGQQQYQNNTPSPYPSNYGNPTLSDLFYKSVYPNENGGAFNRSDWLKFGLGYGLPAIKNIWNKASNPDSDTIGF